MPAPTAKESGAHGRKRNREVTTEEAELWAQEEGLLFVETSAKSGMNVEIAFERATRDILEKVRRGVFDEDRVSRFPCALAISVWVLISSHSTSNSRQVSSCRSLGTTGSPSRRQLRRQDAVSSLRRSDRDVQGHRDARYTTNDMMDIYFASRAGSRFGCVHLLRP